MFWLGFTNKISLRLCVKLILKMRSFDSLALVKSVKTQLAGKLTWQN
jgi:hypothetical protein